MDAPHLVHVFSTFRAAGPQVRTTEIINRLGAEFRHTVMAMDGNVDASARVQPGIDFRVHPAPPKQSSLIAPFTIAGILRGLRPDVVITYNWGAMDAVAAARFGRIAPVIHTEDGFGPEEAVQLIGRRVLTRRILLNRIHRTVVVSKRLLAIALDRYRIRPSKVRYIPNGLDIQRFHPGGDRSLRQAWGVSPGDLVFGYVGHLRVEKNLGFLIRAFLAAAIPHARLVLVGDGAERANLEQLIRESDAGQRVILAGAFPDPFPCLAAFDVFVMSSTTEQAPISLLEAMACGLPCVCTDAGDTGEMLGPLESPFVVPLNDFERYCAALKAIADGAGLRAGIGQENRKRCVGLYSADEMVRQYRKTYLEAVEAASR